jgi:hypothetical protein
MTADRAGPLELPINPPAAALGTVNAVITGTSRLHHVPEFEGTLSIKTVVAGRATWQAGGRRFTVGEKCFLILNDRQRYTLTVDSPQKTTTFCLFFECGFVRKNCPQPVLLRRLNFASASTEHATFCSPRGINRSRSKNLRARRVYPPIIYIVHFDGCSAERRTVCSAITAWNGPRRNCATLHAISPKFVLPQDSRAYPLSVCFFANATVSRHGSIAGQPPALCKFARSDKKWLPGY